MRIYQADCFRRYLEKHRHQLPNYAAYQKVFDSLDQTNEYPFLPACLA